MSRGKNQVDIPELDKLTLETPAVTATFPPVDATTSTVTGQSSHAEAKDPEEVLCADGSVATLLLPPTVIEDRKGEGDSLGNKHSRTQEEDEEEKPKEDQQDKDKQDQHQTQGDMSATSFANTNAHTPHQNIFTPPSPVSTNPFRRSPSVSPTSSAALPASASGHSVEFAGEDPFSVSAAASASTFGSPLTLPALPPSVPITPLRDSTLTLQQVTQSELPPPPAYVQVEEPVSVAATVPSPSSIVLSSPSVIAAPVPTAQAASVTAAAIPTAVRTSASRDAEPKNEYVLKPIDWIDPATGIEKRIKIITQNENGPCPLLALCNTLILQGKVAIRPYDRPTIGYDHLLELLADYLLNEDPSESTLATNTFSSSNTQRVGERVETEKIKSRLEIESALRLLPHLEHGLDVNVFFKSIRGFESTAELGLFHTFGVELVHGWVVSPVIDPSMYALVDGPAAITSYNKAVECIVSGDHAGGGLVVENLNGTRTPISPSNHGSEHSRSNTDGASSSIQDVDLQNERVSQALVVQEFMNATKTQLTPYGLHVLQESLPEGHLCAFFRNNHFCTLFKNPMDGNLYTLVTDQSLAHEQSIVWESLVNVDGAGDFLDGLFRHGALEVGDYARNNQSMDSQHSAGGDGGGDEDFALALQLQQQEEEEEARRLQKQKNRSSSSNDHGQGGSSSDIGSQIYETDAQMAARLHQEYLASSQQQLHQQQKQQQQQQQQQMMQRQQNFAQPYPQPGLYNPYPGSHGSPQAQQVYDPYCQATPMQIQAPMQVQALTQAPGQEQPQPQPQTQRQRQSGHGRHRNSSESSSRKDKSCIIS